MSAVLGASRLPVLRAPFLGLVAVALLLTAVTAPALDDGWALTVLRGVAVVLAAALAVTTDDPAGEVLAAAPVPRPTRTLARAGVGLGVVLPVWLLAVLLAEWRDGSTPVAGLSLEAAALAVLAVAVGAVLRASGTTTPSWGAVVGVALASVGMHLLPARYAMAVGQVWGPPWHAAQLRWGALLVLAAAVLALAVRDPLAGRATEPGPAPTCSSTRAARPAGVR